LTYEKIILFYLYRIRRYESDSSKTLHAIISLNPNIINEAKEKDKNRPKTLKSDLYGLPILLKDNINTKGMPTTAGSYALKDNKNTADAFIVKQLKQHGALILGKLNLSEWAYYLCSGCPLGWSAVGGQTLNPYGPKLFETGGSSSGSGVATAANYAVATIGTETSGSILSPSSKNSVVGLKPTIGLLSRTGIVPISSTLDTPGPMTKSIIDNAIVLAAMTGEDLNDPTTIGNYKNTKYTENITDSDFKGKRLGVMKPLLKDSVYSKTIEKLKIAGVEIIEYDPPKLSLNGFTTLLNIDMKHDLPAYLKKYADTQVNIKSVEDITKLNLLDSLARIPYGQQLFVGILKDTTSNKSFEQIKNKLHSDGIAYFKPIMDEHRLDAVLSMNNNHAGFAAVAKYPCLTVPMGYTIQGEPTGITFISYPFSEKKLLQLGYAFEQLIKARKIPKNYE
jgi:amidase